MREVDDIKRMIAPLMKVLPYIIVVVIGCGVVTFMLLKYSTPIYETELILKMDNSDNSFTKNNLYKDFDVLTSSDKLLTEVQVIKSDLIVKNAIKAMNIPVTYYRLGKLAEAELYPMAPFIVLEDSLKPVKKNFKYKLKIFPDKKITVAHGKKVVKAKLGDFISIGGGRLRIVLNKMWVEKKGSKEIPGVYEFKVNTIPVSYTHLTLPTTSRV